MINAPPRTLRRHVASAIAGLSLMTGIAPAISQQGSLVPVVADGKPWTMTNVDGSGGQITLTSDGKGTMALGSRTISPSWRQSETGQLCIKPVMVVPERCATLRRDGAAIIGLRDGQLQFRLTRP